MQVMDRGLSCAADTVNESGRGMGEGALTGTAGLFTTIGGCGSRGCVASTEFRAVLVADDDSAGGGDTTDEASHSFFRLREGPAVDVVGREEDAEVGGGPTE